MKFFMHLYFLFPIFIKFLSNITLFWARIDSETELLLRIDGYSTGYRGDRTKNIYAPLTLKELCGRWR